MRRFLGGFSARSGNSETPRLKKAGVLTGSLAVAFAFEIIASQFEGVLRTPIHRPSLMLVFGLLLIGGSGVLVVGLFTGKIQFPNLPGLPGSSNYTTGNTNLPIPGQTGGQAGSKSTISKQQAIMYAQNAGFSGDALRTIVAIAQGESSLNPLAINCGNSGGSCDRGILQFNNRSHPEISDAQAYDPAAAFREAFRVSNGGTNFSAWVAYTNGSYQQYLL